MCGPAGMADAGFARERLMHQEVRKVHQLADSTPPIKVPGIDCGYPRRVISAIFEPFQCLDEKGGHLMLAQNADDTAHLLCLPNNSDDPSFRRRAMCLSDARCRGLVRRCKGPTFTRTYGRFQLEGGQVDCIASPKNPTRVALSYFWRLNPVIWQCPKNAQLQHQFADLCPSCYGASCIVQNGYGSGHARSGNIWTALDFCRDSAPEPTRTPGVVPRLSRSGQAKAG